MFVVQQKAKKTKFHIHKNGYFVVSIKKLVFLMLGIHINFKPEIYIFLCYLEPIKTDDTSIPKNK